MSNATGLYTRAYTDRGDWTREPAGSPIPFTGSTPGPKRDGLDLKLDRWRLENYRNSGGPVLWCHDHKRPPIGAADAAVESRRLRMPAHFDQEDPFAVSIESKLRRGYLRACSVGWDFVDRAGNRLDHNRHSPTWLTDNAYYDLTELSVVPIGADPLAMAERQRRALGSLGRELVQLYDTQERADSDVTADELFPAVVEWCRRYGVDLGEYADLSHVPNYRDVDPTFIRGGIPTHHTPVADMGMDWDADAERAKAEGADQLRRMHALVDYDGDEDVKDSYHLPHHTADGRLVWRGLAAAMGRLNQVDADDEAKAGAYRHLAAHYRQLGKQPPERSATLAGYVRWDEVELIRNVPAQAGPTTSADAVVDDQAARAVLAAFDLKGAS